MDESHVEQRHPGLRSDHRTTARYHCRNSGLRISMLELLGTYLRHRVKTGELEGYDYEGPKVCHKTNVRVDSKF